MIIGKVRRRGKSCEERKGKERKGKERKNILSSLGIRLAQVLQPTSILDDNGLSSLWLRPSARDVGDFVDAHCVVLFVLDVCLRPCCLCSGEQVSDRAERYISRRMWSVQPLPQLSICNLLVRCPLSSNVRFFLAFISFSSCQLTLLEVNHKKQLISDHDLTLSPDIDIIVDGYRQSPIVLPLSFTSSLLVKGRFLGRI